MSNAKKETADNTLRIGAVAYDRKRSPSGKDSKTTFRVSVKACPP